MYDHPSNSRRSPSRRAANAPNSPRRCGRAPDDVVFRREQYGTDAALVVVGEVDGFNAYTFRRELIKLLNSAYSVAWLDLTELWFIDGRGLNALLEAREVALHAGVELVLRAPSLPVRRMLVVSGAADAFRLDDEQ